MPSLLTLNPNIALVVVTDVGINVVRGWNEFFDSNHLSFPVCFLVFETKKMPFASRSIKTLTSNVGFSSMYDMLTAFREAERILAVRWHYICR